MPPTKGNYFRQGEGKGLSEVTPSQIHGDLDFFNGTFLESFDALITSDGATITMTLTNSADAAADLTMNFSDGQTTYDVSAGNTIALTAGTQAAPQSNYIYIPQSTKVLTKSTTQWPAAEHIKVSFFVVQTAGLVQTVGELANQNWNDHAQGTDSQGHLSHITERIRASYALYRSGLDLTVTGSGTGTIDLDTTAGVAFQMHKQSLAAWDTSGADLLHVVNHNGGAYSTTADFETLVADSTGGSLNNKFYNVVLWRVCNKGGEYSPTMLNLPSGSYNSLSTAEEDASGYDTYAMPSAYTADSSTGLLMYRLTFKHSSAAGGTWTHHSTKDLRGSTPVSLAGTGTGTTLTEFSDGLFKIFNASDATKILDLDASSITTATTRTVTMADQDIDLADVIHEIHIPLFATATPRNFNGTGFT